ncbi:MAG TPA: tripartite tricarboxylate transporter substrate binding protein [Candidatus Methylomirabilis sp.]|nr:tripartite tricarboxylate transporter substrate binding protein [Candidatus Methylomirabilis sp.]
MKVEKRRKRFGALLATAVWVAVLLLAGTVSEAAWPEKGKVLTLYVASGAGGGSDMAGRMIAQVLEKELDVKVVVVNKGGGGSQIGVTEYLAKAGTDGYTVLAANTPVTISPYMDPSRKATYHLGRDIQLAGAYGWSPCAIAVKKGGKYKTLKELVEAARANPGKIKGTASGPLVQNDLAMVLLNKVAGVQIARMYFDQQGEQRAALLGGHVDAEFNNDFELIAGQKSGEIETLAIWDKVPAAALPGVPTGESLGFPVHMAAAYGLGYKTGTPQEVLDRVEAALIRGVKKPENAELFKKIGLSATVMTGKEYREYWTGIEKVVGEVIQGMKK